MILVLDIRHYISVSEAIVKDQSVYKNNIQCVYKYSTQYKYRHPPEGKCEVIVFGSGCDSSMCRFRWHTGHTLSNVQVRSTSCCQSFFFLVTINERFCFGCCYTICNVHFFFLSHTYINITW